MTDAPILRVLLFYPPVGNGATFFLGHGSLIDANTVFASSAAAAAPAAMFEVDNCSEATVSGVTLKHNHAEPCGAVLAFTRTHSRVEWADVTATLNAALNATVHASAPLVSCSSALFESNAAVGPDASAGALHSLSAHVLLSNVRFEGNSVGPTAPGAGALNAEGGNVTLVEHCYVTSNKGGMRGALLAFKCNMTGGSVVNNEACAAASPAPRSRSHAASSLVDRSEGSVRPFAAPMGGSGGGIYAVEVYLDGVSMSGNTATCDGGCVFAETIAVIHATYFSNCVAETGDGGAVYAPDGRVTILSGNGHSESTFNENEAGIGSAIVLRRGNVAGSFSRNVARTLGGGAVQVLYSANLSNAEFSSNKAEGCVYRIGRSGVRCGTN
eukprot:TRINITY_DN431_c1_g1_i4.p1 TRINITY_DN431_c1_g1~~TRINITY_DN431_c1_g1_i4.p1  ORF type:complete len:429 (+),score=112.88 TRINITY_DN431_c1_g1_i4:137-1288(+)